MKIDADEGLRILRLQCVECGGRYHLVEEPGLIPWCRSCMSTDYVIEGRIPARQRGSSALHGGGRTPTAA